ncbi:MAG: hypothetical protein A2Z57_05440 [Planctomycetes bacterium RIFCSPHIGHO2_12_39_6]|uniref:Steroid 5-alpha reductase C-terminal domain-containing protein n=1 Tax=Candidatus Curtissbacteria bacterium RIFCSPLOWO2_01_FULL_42_26 TaxID=1797729 RepID=A0A1F5I0K6_9BACT|nr:MAG: hypothetical protein A3A60_04920 [Candidatus Curtissbacteria bacterium RIFCSPLOWO2_01_FULL_42_26]OHB99426.1 MAG: hypothetical protein A2Z57_05440 [Planctomycetes bacterium RIFCSPHIGHO2_12_39_6]
MKGKFLLYAQIVLIILLFLFSVPNAIFKSPVISTVFAAGLLLGIWSLYNLGLDTYTPFPEPKKEGKHVQTGAYKYARHPMYTAVIVIGLALFLSSPTLYSAIIYLVLIIILDQKATLEEKYLQNLHPTYKSYAQKTKKFVPYLY